MGNRWAATLPTPVRAQRAPQRHHSNTTDTTQQQHYTTTWRLRMAARMVEAISGFIVAPILKSDIFLSDTDAVPMNYVPFQSGKDAALETLAFSKS